MRLFFGVEIPDRVRARLARVQSLLRDSQADVRWVEPRNTHFTLAFLGQVDDNEIGVLDKLACHAAATTPSVFLTLEGLGTFPDRLRPRVVWVGVTGKLEPLIGLHQALRRGLADLGFWVDRRPFRPHVTLGRIKRSRRLGTLDEHITANENKVIGSFEMQRFVLFQSRLSRDGPRYDVAASYRLAG